MNIFFLSFCKEVCARWHCDKHVVKMILEYAQLLCTAHRVLDGELKLVLRGKRKMKTYELSGEMEAVVYKATHVNHPCALWVRESSANYMYLYKLFCLLCEEYTHRYGKTHLTEKKLRVLLSRVPRKLRREGQRDKLTPFPQAMPEQYRGKCAVSAYRRYYINEKKKLLKYTRREVPGWIPNLPEDA